jgi:hypothetical protein
MNSPVRPGIGAVTALMVALVGCQSTPAGSATAGGPTLVPSATPAATTTSSPEPAAPPKLPAETHNLKAGTYTLDPNLAVTIEAPGGWETCCDGVILKSDFAGLLYWGNAQGITVYSDPCLWSSGGGSNPEGSQAIAAALAAQKNREASEPHAVTVGALPAVVVRLKVPLDQPVTTDAHGDNTFNGCDQGQFRSFTVGPDGERHHQAPGQIDDFYVLEIGTTTVIFDVISGPQIAPSDMADLEAILASVKIG